MNLTETLIKAENIIEDLEFAIEKEQVEEIFERNKIDDKSERIQLLRKCMHVLDTSNADESLTLEEEYNDELVIFINGKWRLFI